MIQPKKKTRKKRESLDTLYDKRNRALERVVALWEKDQDVNHAAYSPPTNSNVAAA
jgi:uncharacterized coiled-coil DUF342 family protein